MKDPKGGLEQSWVPSRTSDPSMCGSKKPLT